MDNLRFERYDERNALQEEQCLTLTVHRIDGFRLKQSVSFSRGLGPSSLSATYIIGFTMRSVIDLSAIALILHQRGDAPW